MNYDPISSVVLQTIKQYGQAIKIIKASGSSGKSYGVWGETINSEVKDGMMGNITQKIQIIYLPYVALSRVIPEVGDTILVNKVQYAVNKVTAYQPTDKAVGYKLEVIA